jgi:Domain of unknown function (DUF4328)
VIQVCSRCGTRWNVRDRQRVWCPRCNGTLLAPSDVVGDQQWSQHLSAPSPAKAGERVATRPPPGYRWIAVRPGAAPLRRRRAPELGPTPRYSTIPRWGLQDHFEPTDVDAAPVVRTGPSVRVVRATLVTTMVLFGFAALVHVVRYGLLLINRSILLPPLVAGVATWVGVAASVLAVFAMVAMAVVLTNWLIARRAAAFARLQRDETRSTLELYAGCLIPVVNLFFAPVFVIELALIESRTRDLHRPIVSWWCAWVFSFFLSAYAAVSALPPFTRDTQSVADNTVTTTIAYLAALAALLLLNRVFVRFESTPVDRPLKRWVAVRDDQIFGEQPADAVAPAESAERESAIPVEAERQDPAA